MNFAQSVQEWWGIVRILTEKAGNDVKNGGNDAICVIIFRVGEALRLFFVAIIGTATFATFATLQHLSEACFDRNFSAIWSGEGTASP